MIASTSHDMRTPLNTIISMTSLIKYKIQDNPQLNQWLDAASNSTNLLLYLVNDTLDYFQIKSGKFKEKISTFTITEVVEGCFSLISMPMEQKRLTQYSDIDPQIMGKTYL